MHAHTRTYIIYVCFLIAKILSIRKTLRSFIHGPLNEDTQEEWTLKEQRNTTFTQDMRGK